MHVIPKGLIVMCCVPDACVCLKLKPLKLLMFEETKGSEQGAIYESTGLEIQLDLFFNLIVL